MMSKVKKNIVAGSAAVALLAPAIGFAQPANGVFSLIDTVGDIIAAIIPVIIGLALLVFLFGVFKYVISSDEDAKTKGRDFMIWGIIGLFVMTAVWGLVGLLDDTLNLDNATPNVPEFPN